MKLLKITVFLLFITGSYHVSGQNADTLYTSRSFNGAITLTTKGLSTFPNLTLGKPAVVCDFSMGGEKLKFEPTLRFALDGKPWTFLLWFRYQVMKNEKFLLKLGVHPCYSFKTITVSDNGSASEITQVRQFLTGEVAPVFFIAKNISAGPYYIYAKGVSADVVKSSNFFSVRANFSHIPLGEEYFLKFFAQTYFLKLDEQEGFYVHSTLSFNKRNFPITISSAINQKIHSTIPCDNFLWNINLTYTFSNRYKKI